MNHRSVLLVILLVLASVCSAGCADSPTPTKPLEGSILPGHATWELTFHDEFDGPGMDWSTWTSQDGPRGGTHPEGRWPENNVVENGLLKQVCLYHQQPRGGKHWSTAHIWSTTFEQQYGYFEARIRYGKHLNNAFWLYRPETDRFTKPPFFEIDINEGHTPREVAMTVHYWRKPAGAEQWDLFSTNKMWDAPMDLDEGFHVYGCEWDRDRIVWYFDGKPIRHLNNAGAHAPADVRLSTVFRGAPRNPDGTISRQMDGVSMDIDWVRVYRKAADRSGEVPPVWATVEQQHWEPPTVKPVPPQVSQKGKTEVVFRDDFEEATPGKAPAGWTTGNRKPQVVPYPDEFSHNKLELGRRVLRLEGGDYLLRMFKPGVKGRMEVNFDMATRRRNPGLLLVTLGRFDVSNEKTLPTSYYQGDIGPYIHWSRNFLQYYRDPERWVPFSLRTDSGTWQHVRFVIDIDKNVFDCYVGRGVGRHIGGGRFRHDQKQALGIGLKHRLPSSRPFYIDNVEVKRYTTDSN